MARNNENLKVDTEIKVLRRKKYCFLASSIQKIQNFEMQDTTPQGRMCWASNIRKFRWPRPLAFPCDDDSVFQLKTNRF